MSKSKIYNLIILDKSGSMSSIVNEAIGGVNETINSIKVMDKQNCEKQEQYITLVAFCGCEILYIFDNVPAQEAHIITPKDYEPCCMTPLYDAIEKSITKMHKLIKEDHLATASVTIITDGYENASQEYSHESVKSLIESYKKDGWLFAYIGADHDVEAVSFSLSIENHLKFEKSSHGTREMFHKYQKSRNRWNSKVSESFEKTGAIIPQCMEDCNNNFFNEDDKNSDK